ncbi:MAG: ABC transporter substrate-binding protein [Proteobacteria bacterium]|nr:ABC transporter substrate-binding protein [Pseudomonadota bacterium]
MSTLKTAIADHGLTQQFWRGATAARLELERVPVERAVTAMRRMVRNLDFDICEMAFATYLCAKVAGVPITALPIFVTRGFHQRAIHVRRGSGVTGPKDLEGRDVLVNRGFTVTTNVWARGILAAEYGVDLDSIRWLPTDDEHVAQYRAPAEVDYRHRGEDIVGLLLTGAYDAAVGDIQSDDPTIVPLIADARQAGIDYFRKTGVYPVNHTIVVKNEALQRNPGLARDLCAGFMESKEAHRARLEAGVGLSSAEAVARDLSRVLGDPFPFGLTANQRALDTLIRFAAAQRVIPRALPIAELFAAGGAELD